MKSPFRSKTFARAFWFVALLFLGTGYVILTYGIHLRDVPESKIEELKLAIEDPAARVIAVRGRVTGYWEKGFLLQSPRPPARKDLSPGLLVKSSGTQPILDDSVLVQGTLEGGIFVAKRFSQVQALPVPDPVVLEDPLPAKTAKDFWLPLKDVRVQWRDKAYRVTWEKGTAELLPLLSKAPLE